MGFKNVRGIKGKRALVVFLLREKRQKFFFWMILNPRPN